MILTYIIKDCHNADKRFIVKAHNNGKLAFQIEINGFRLSNRFKPTTKDELASYGVTIY